jgi:hypothetical protein
MQADSKDVCVREIFRIKGTVSRIFASGFFHKSSSPITFQSHFKFFGKFTEIFASQVSPPVSTTNRWQIFPPVPLVLLIQVANLPLVSTILVANLLPVSMTPGKIATDINNTGDKFATGVNNTGGK